MSTLEITLSGNTYRVGKLSALQQFHVSRKIAPLVPALAPAVAAIRAASGDAFNLLEILPEFEPFAQALAALEDAAAEEVLGACLSCVHRQQGESWTPVWNAQAKAVMFDDVDIGVLLPLVVRVITHNLGPFIQGLLTGQSPRPQTSPA